MLNLCHLQERLQNVPVQSTSVETQQTSAAVPAAGATSLEINQNIQSFTDSFSGQQTSMELARGRLLQLETSFDDVNKKVQAFTAQCQAAKTEEARTQAEQVQVHSSDSQLVEITTIDVDNIEMFSLADS